MSAVMSYHITFILVHVVDRVREKSRRAEQIVPVAGTVRRRVGPAAMRDGGARSRSGSTWGRATPR